MTPEPYTSKDLTRAVNLAALLGWTAITISLIGDTLATGSFGILVLAAVIGLPVAFAACWLIGAPLLHRAMRRPITWVRAALWGALIASVMAAIGIAFMRIRGLLRSIDDSRYSQIGGGDFVQSVDGILTPYGWWILVQNTAGFIGAAVIVALIIRAAIGPGRRPEQEVVE